MKLSRHHLLITLGFLLHLYNNAAYRFLDSFLPAYATKDEGVSEFEVGVMFASFCLAIFVLSPVFGGLCHRRGYRSVIVAGLCVEGVVLCLLSLSSLLHGPSFIAYLTILRALEGAGSAATQTGCYALLAAESGDEGEGAGTGMGGMEMFGGLGNMMGPIIGASLSATYGYRTPFIAIGALGLLSAVATACTLPSKQQLIDEVDLTFIRDHTLPMAPPPAAHAAPPSPVSSSSSSLSPSTSIATFSYSLPPSTTRPKLLPSSSSRSDVSTSVRAFVGEELQPANSASSPPPVTVLTVLRVPSVLYSCVVAAASLGCSSFLSVTLELAFERQFHMTNVEVGMCFALMSFVQLLFCPIAGWIGDHGPTKLPMVVGLSTLAVSLLMLGPSPLFPIEPNLPLQLIALCLLGAGVSLALIPTFADSIKATAHLGVASQSVIAGLSASVFSLGEVLGPFVGSSLVSLTSFEVASTALAGLVAGVLGVGVVCMALGVVPWDVGKMREEAVRRGAEAQPDQGVEMVHNHSHPRHPSPPHSRPGSVQAVVDLITAKVDQRKRRRAGYEKAGGVDVSPSSSPSPSGSPTSAAAHPHYSPSDSFILRLEDSEQGVGRGKGKEWEGRGREEVKERWEGGEGEGEEEEEEEEEEGVMELGGLGEDEMEDIDMVGEAGSLVEYDLDDEGLEDERKEARLSSSEESQDRDVDQRVNIRAAAEAEAKQRTSDEGT